MTAGRRERTMPLAARACRAAGGRRDHGANGRWLTGEESARGHGGKEEKGRRSGGRKSEVKGTGGEEAVKSVGEVRGSGGAAGRASSGGATARGSSHRRSRRSPVFVRAGLEARVEGEKSVRGRRAHASGDNRQVSLRARLTIAR